MDTWVFKANDIWEFNPTALDFGVIINNDSDLRQALDDNSIGGDGILDANDSRFSVDPLAPNDLIYTSNSRGTITFENVSRIRVGQVFYNS